MELLDFQVPTRVTNYPSEKLSKARPVGSENGCDLRLAPPNGGGMVHPPRRPCEYVALIEGQSRPVRHTFDDDDGAEECEPTANGGVITGVGESTQWCVKAKATVLKSNGLDKPTLKGY